VSTKPDQCQPAASIPSWTPDAAESDDVTGEAHDTLVVSNVHLLDAAQQRGLFRAIGAWRGRVRVIATSTAPLYPLVAAHQFDEALYYRLNILSVHAISSRLPQGAAGGVCPADDSKGHLSTLYGMPGHLPDVYARDTPL
jgi:hypothetical protein